MKRNKVAFKLGSVIVVVFIVVLSLLGLAVERMFTNFYNSEMKTEVKELTAHFTTMNELNDVSAEQSLLKFADFSNVSILYIDKQGKAIAYSGKYDFTDRSFIHSNDMKALFSGRSVGIEHTDAKGDRYFVAAEPILDRSGKNIPFAVYLLSSTKHMDESISAVRKLLILSGIGAFLLALGITYIIAQILSRPLLQMQEATRKIAIGELETRLNITSNDEIGALAKEINNLGEDLQRYRDTRQEFFANISHELRTPITYLEGYARIIKNQLYETEEEKDMYLEIIYQEALRLQHMVNELFELAKMEEGKISLTLGWVDLNEITDNSVRKIQFKALDKALHLNAHMDRRVPLIYGDGLRLEQVLINLLENAVRYTEKGEINVYLNMDENFFHLIVEDTGVGIPEAELSLIFERFYRVEKSRSRQYGGTGLGLSIAKKLVELHKGELLVSSKTGIGTRFEIRLKREIQEEWV